MKPKSSATKNSSTVLLSWGGCCGGIGIGLVLRLVIIII